MSELYRLATPSKVVLRVILISLVSQTEQIFQEDGQVSNHGGKVPEQIFKLFTGENHPEPFTGAASNAATGWRVTHSGEDRMRGEGTGKWKAKEG